MPDYEYYESDEVTQFSTLNEESIDRVDSCCAESDGNNDSPMIRKNFPETWIWDLFEGYEGFDDRNRRIY